MVYPRISMAIQRHILFQGAIGIGIGLVGGYFWKSGHWEAKRKIREYYARLDVEAPKPDAQSS